MKGTGLVSFALLVALLVSSCGESETTAGEDGRGSGWRIQPGGDTVIGSTDGSRGTIDSDVGAAEDGALPRNDAPRLTDAHRGIPDLPPPQEYLAEDAGCIPGTKCYENQYKIMGSLLNIIVDDQAINPEWYLLDVLPPNGMTVKVSVKSSGFNQLNLVDAFIEPGGNPFITFQWTTPGLPGGLPMVLMPGETAEGQITYQPQGDPPPNPSVFTVWSSDPDHLSRSVTFKARESGPDIELPYSAVNYGCGNYCFGHEFVIENAGNKDLVIQSTQFENQSGEWSVQGPPASGTTLPPKGAPGYAPIGFVIDYCDGDGNYNNDSNQFLIHSNDPDESPAAIHLNVMLPNQCP